MKRFIVSALLALALLALPFTVWAGPAKSDYNWHGTGWQMFYDGSTFETFYGSAPISYAEEFLSGNGTLPDATSGAGSPADDWFKTTVGDGAVAFVADGGGTGGSVNATMNATSAAETAAGYWFDNRRFDLSHGLVAEFRVKFNTAPTIGAEMSFGLIGDYTTPDSIAEALLFDCDGSDVLNIQQRDGTATVNATATDTDGDSINATIPDGTNTWWIARIDATDTTDIKFYVNGERVAATSTFAWTSGEETHLQPYFGAYKASGAGVGELLVDYVRIWSNRE